MADKSICFLTRGDYSWASARLRCHWPARYIPGAQVVQWGKPGQQIPEGFPLYVWLKSGDPETMRQIRDDGGRNVIDICDPMWWWGPQEAQALDDCADHVTIATNAAAADYLDWATWRSRDSVSIIPDRLDLSEYPAVLRPAQAADPVRFIWYGMAQNRVGVFAALAYLERLHANGVRLTLTICDNAPGDQWNITDAFPIGYVRWSLEHEAEIMQAHDVALVPPYPGPWGKLKTNNKTLTAWAYGLPATDGQDWDTLYNLATRRDYRAAMAKAGREELGARYDVRQSAQQWAELLEALR